MSDETPKLRAERECDAAGHETVYCLCDMYDAEADGYRRGVEEAAKTADAQTNFLLEQGDGLMQDVHAGTVEAIRALLDRKGEK